MSAGPVPRWPGAAGPVLALAALACVHVTAAGSVDPVNGLISEYALLDGSAWAMTCGMIALAMGSVWVAYLLSRLDPARGAAARVLFLAAALGLLLAAAFPTDTEAAVTSVGGEIHRWSAAVVFTALPCAGWMVARRSGNRTLAGVAVASVMLLAAFLAAHPGSPASDLVGDPGYHGLFQRLLVLADITLVLLAARRVGEKGGHPVTGALVPRPSGSGASARV
ncbi:hypothetical protein FHS43_001348 [Streptosporangium becharense]|uniref:DUF998 domain-containing protein n=1 Tax=Streptosporangium becharense TaxID=1816182 RepID=A0A7W9IDX0_9ACTN|nr:DUF998 domain-containing protein [Streptosporangium becharense]MBB2910102.1 hypothetical protein [Streptosporangium becharense]MBB5818943.1 hypothetical protein [Streptosporangium becharense]